MSTPTSILSRPLNIYALPPVLLENLSVRTIQTGAPDESLQSDGDEEGGEPSNLASSSATQNNGPIGSLRCQTCPNATFETVEEQRAHFRSDRHRYNVKAKMGGKAVTAEEWDNMVEDISSLSGSESSSSGASTSSQPNGVSTGTGNGATSKLSKLLAKQSINQAGAEDETDEEAENADRLRRAQLRTATIWFTPTRALPELGVSKDTQFGMTRAMFPPFERAEEYLTELARMQLRDMAPQEDEDKERRITLLMVAGGHFAGMVVLLRPRGVRERQDVKGAGDVKILKSKTFHRYTTRKKQGGSQGLKDAGGSKAISAGAMLRRYGEQSLMEEIRKLLSDWEEDLQLSERIFLRASTHGKRSFWGYDGAVLDKNDPRLRVFPFPTRRPTLQELLRCWHELVRVKVSHLSEDALAQLDEAYITSLQPRKQPVKPLAAASATPATPAPPPKDPEEEARKDRQKRLEEMIRKGRLDALRPFWQKHHEEFEATTSMTPLGTAASAGQEDMLRFFLEEARLDPTKSVSSTDTRKPYDLASSKGARNVFRRVRHEHEDWYDWPAAHVPVGLSEEAEAAQDAKKNERRKGLREKMKEREKARAAAAPAQEEPEPEPQPQQQGSSSVLGSVGLGPQKLGGRGQDGSLAGLTPEMRMKIERERRARAAEARFGKQ